MTFNVEMEGAVKMTVQVCAKSEGDAKRIASDYFQEVLKPGENSDPAEKARSIDLNLVFVDKI